MTVDPSQHSMCEDCRQLVNAGRSTPPHENLSEYRSKQMSTAPAPAGEQYYICNVCRQDWRLDTRGGGWIAS